MRGFITTCDQMASSYNFIFEKKKCHIIQFNQLPTRYSHY